MRLLLTTLLGVILTTTSVFAAPPDVNTIVQEMRKVFEPAQPSTRKVIISIEAANGDKVQWRAVQARKQQQDGKRTVLVVLEPEHTKGNTLLVWERDGQPDTMWWYPPALRRVRQLVPVEAYQSFLDTDFTYADLGFIDRDGTYRLLGEEEHEGKQTYKIELVPKRQVFFSRIITWVAADTMLPMQRDYHDVAGQLWKTMTFGQVEVIDEVPTPLHIRMHDHQQNSSTEITFSDVRYGVDIPDVLFDPGHLPLTVEARFWREMDALAVKKEQ